MRIERVISGGQTGADRGALDAAIDLGIPHGGFCPKGRLAEDGEVPARYALVELANRAYEGRTRKNVESSDATIVFTRGKPTGGSALTIAHAEKSGKPVLAIDLNASSSFDACITLDAFVQRLHPRVLNVAGSRESQSPGMAASVREIVRRALADAPLCAHLRPIGDALEAANVRFGPIPSPYADEHLTWFMCGATFDEPSLRARLALDDCVKYAEYDGRAAGADATFTCTRCDQTLLGVHPQYAGGSPRLA